MPHHHEERAGADAHDTAATSSDGGPEDLRDPAAGPSLLNGRYELLQTLVNGDAGSVHLAVDHRPAAALDLGPLGEVGALVAIKFFGSVLAGSITEQARALANKEIQMMATVGRAVDEVNERRAAEGGRQLDCFAGMLDHFDSGGAIAMVLEASPCDLFAVVVDRDQEGFDLAEIRHISVSILTALSFLHERGYAHLDIKPENILVRISPPPITPDSHVHRTHPKARPILAQWAYSEAAYDDTFQRLVGAGEDVPAAAVSAAFWAVSALLVGSAADRRTLAGATVSLCDLGLAVAFIDGELCHSACGTAIYAAPEVRSGVPYNPRCADVFSLGVVLLNLYTTVQPWDQATVDDPVFDRFCNVKGDFWQWMRYHSVQEISTEFQALINGMCDPDPRHRLTVHECLTHPFFAGD